MYFKFINIFILIFSINANVYGLSFDDALKLIKDHDTVKSLEQSSNIANDSSSLNSSWGDPDLKISAKNFPKETLSFDQTPMTGIEFNISQKIPLTTKYGNLKKSGESISESLKYESLYQGRYLEKRVWVHLINSKKIDEEIKILKSNLNWIDRMLKVTKKLYSNGKTSQQALLELQIRKSEIEVEIDNRLHDYSGEEEKIFYIIGKRESIDRKTIPWNLLKGISKESLDVKELSLKSKLNASESLLSAKSLAVIPDLTVSLGYTKRSNIDNNGDFVSASVSFPLPFSGKKYTDKSIAIHTKSRSIIDLSNYKKLKNQKIFHLLHEKEKIISELKILNSKTIKFAENSKLITSKSYSLGNSSYLELLQSELKLQGLLMKRSSLDARLSITQVNKKFILGENLHE